MSGTPIQWRGGNTAAVAAFTGAAREVVVDTQKNTLVVQDGSTAGGFELLRKDLSNNTAVLTLTGSQSPTNKTFDNTNAYTIKSNKLTFQDSSDATKQVTLDLSGITTANTRAFAFPDHGGTLATQAGTETLTNKTIAAGSNTITMATTNLSDVTAKASFTPGVTINGSASGITFSVQRGEYAVVGNLVNFQIEITLSSKGSSTGAVVITGLPVTPNAGSISQFPVVMSVNSCSGLSGTLVAQWQGGTSLVLFYTGTGALNAVADTNLANGSSFWISGSFIK